MIATLIFLICPFGDMDRCEYKTLSEITGVYGMESEMNMTTCLIIGQRIWAEVVEERVQDPQDPRFLKAYYCRPGRAA